MNLTIFKPDNPDQRLQLRLFLAAVAFMFFASLSVMISPAVRIQAWQVGLKWSHWLGFFSWLAVFTFLLSITNKKLPEHDPFILPIIMFLTGWGLITIWRLDSGFGLRQTLWLLVCGAVYWGLLYVKDLPGLLHKYKYLWLVGGLALTALTFVFGVYPGGEGPRLWLRIGGVFFQPSEPLKLLLVVFLAAYLADRFPVSFNFARLIIPSFALFLAALVILLAQHDLGTAAIFIILYVGIIFLASSRRRMIIVGGAFLLAAGLAGYKLYSVIQIRVNAWLNPWLDPAGKSYQIIQSLLAFAAGGVFGRGPGLGSPGLVPIAHSDFITAAIGEEYGLIGTIGLFVMFCLFAYRGFKISLQARTQYHRYLAAGITIYIIAQSILIIGGNLRMLPLTGVTLPFISYGGSSLLTSFIGGLLLLLISNDRDQEAVPLQKSTGFQLIQGILLASFIGLSVSNGWWSLIRSNDLQSRSDNPRLSIAEKYSLRGSILDQNNQVIVQTEGQPGDYWRHFLYPPLSPITGYNDPVYGQSGLESSLDGYLRGIEGNPSSVIWLHHFLYGEPPPGLDVRLSIELTVQQKADALLGSHRGALIVMNANSGEILALASHPNIDPNQVASQWINWMSDPTSPLLDRALQSEYTFGAGISPFLAAGLTPAQTDQKFLSPDVEYSGQTIQCALADLANLSLGSLITAGCPSPALQLAQTLGNDQIFSIMSAFGFTSTPEIQLDQSAASSNLNLSDLSKFLFGSNQFRVTPLQVARAASAITNGGTLVSPRLVSSIKNPVQGWIILPTNPSKVVDLPNIKTLSNQLAQTDTHVWTVTVSSQSDQGILTWAYGGTTSGWAGTPVAISLVLEENNPAVANQVVNGLLVQMQNP